MKSISTKHLYDKLSVLGSPGKIELIPEIEALIKKFEDAISCAIDDGIKSNPKLPYDVQLGISNAIDMLKDTKTSLTTEQIVAIISIVEFIVSGKIKESKKETTENEILQKEDILEFFKKRNLEEWMKLGARDILKIKFRGMGIHKIGTILGWKSKDNTPIRSTCGFQEFIAWVFGKEAETIVTKKKNDATKEKAILTKDEVLEFFRKRTFEEWIKLSTKDIGNLELKGRKIQSLVKIVKWENKNNVFVTSPQGFRVFISWVFEKKNEVIEKCILTKDEVLEFFRKRTFEEWIKLSTKDIGNLELKGRKIQKIATIAGWGNKNKVRIEKPYGFNEFIAWIFQK